MELLADKVIVITGAAGGIGAAAALSMAKHGAKGIVIVDLDFEKAYRTSEDIAQKNVCDCIAVKANVSDENDVHHVFDMTLKKFGTVDVLVNSAGICRIAKMDDITMAEWDRTMDINLKGTFLFCRSALKIMKENRSGKIVNVASQAGKIGGLIVGPDYPASKAAVLCLTKTLAKAAAPFNINVNSVAPGLIATEMTRDFGYDRKSVPLGRIGSAEEVANAIVFLASDMSGYITGACIDVNGGMTMW
jgi:Dehydrogenases with different specificities (related to short-chain alcohol dehydrogenases)